MIFFLDVPKLDIEQRCIEERCLAFDIDDLLYLGPILYCGVNRFGLNVKALLQ